MTMLNFTKKLNAQELAHTPRVFDQVVLPFNLRQKSRLRVTLQSGLEAALMLERGTVLRGGDLLQSESGVVIEVIAALEPVYLIADNRALDLMRAAYHLGNRHVPLEIGDRYLQLEQDHVLKEMLLGLNIRITEKLAPFEPESGAYGGGHRHGHDDDDLINLRPPARLKNGE
jgi:urease accessory protein